MIIRTVMPVKSRTDRNCFHHLGGGGRGRYHSRSTRRSSSRSQGPGAGLLGTSSIARGLRDGSGGGSALRSQSSSFMRLRLARRTSSLRPTRRATSSYSERQYLLQALGPIEVSTHIFQVGNDVEEIICLLKFVSGFRDSFLHH